MPLEGGRMKDLIRLLRYARRYTGQLLASVALMALAGGGTGMLALLVGPLLYIVLDVRAPEQRVLLYPHPILGHLLYLDDIVPAHNVWSAVAIGILGVFLIKGVCDYFG